MRSVKKEGLAPGRASRSHAISFVQQKSRTGRLFFFFFAAPRLNVASSSRLGFCYSALKACRKIEVFVSVSTLCT